jgi:hypothetical protein
MSRIIFRQVIRRVNCRTASVAGSCCRWPSHPQRFQQGEWRPRNCVPLHPRNSRHVSDHVVLACLGLRPQTCSKIVSWKMATAGPCRRVVGRTIMQIEALMIWLFIGAVAGWLAGVLVKGYGFGLIGNTWRALLAPSLPAGCCRASDFFSWAVYSRKSLTPSSGQ